MILALAMAAFFARRGFPLEIAHDRQDRAVLEKMAGEYSAAADQAPGKAETQYHAALACSYLAGVDIELHDRKAARDAAERGIKAGERAVALKPDDPEYLRVLGTLYGQAVTDLMSGLRYGSKRQGRHRQGRSEGAQFIFRLPGAGSGQSVPARAARWRTEGGHPGFPQGHRAGSQECRSATCSWG